MIYSGDMKKIHENIAHSFKDAKAFDEMFWKKAGYEARFSATWLMVRDYYKIRGKNGTLQRLRRTVQNIQFL